MGKAIIITGASLPHHPIVRGVVDYVEENYAASISLRHVAQALGYSPAYLTHMFSSLTGTPVTAWIIKRRLFAAQELLIETRQAVFSVCEAVGFGDACYFNRQFLRHVGVTPKQFRSANKITWSDSPYDPMYAERRRKALRQAHR